jgi:hypothetical protein
MYGKCREDRKSGFKRLNKLPYEKRSLLTAMKARSLHTHAMHYGPARALSLGSPSTVLSGSGSMGIEYLTSASTSAKA